MTRVTVLRPAFLSRDPPCPISNQSLPCIHSASPLWRSAGRRPGAGPPSLVRAGSATGAPPKRACRIHTLPSCDSDPQVHAPSALAPAPSIPPARHRILSVAPPDTHRSTTNSLLEVLRCVSGGVRAGLGRGRGGLVSQKTCQRAYAPGGLTPEESQIVEDSTKK